MVEIGMLMLCCLTIVVAPILAASISSMNGECPENKYWDRGLDHCEPCSLICTDAKERGTVEECESNCPAIFKAMQDKEEKPALGMSKQQPDKPSSFSSSLSGGEIGGIAAGLIIVVVLSVIALLLVKRSRKRTQQLQHQTNQRPDYALVPQNGVQEENNEQAVVEREYHVSSLCDLRRLWTSSAVRGPVHRQETRDGRQGPHELVVACSSQSSQGSALGSETRTSAQPVSTPTAHHHSHFQNFFHSAKSSRPIYTPPGSKCGSPRLATSAGHCSSTSATGATATNAQVTRV